MTRFLIGAAAIALVAGSPASAQLLGGLGGGLGGSLNGGFGSQLGGTLGNTMNSGTASLTHNESLRLDRTARRQAARQERQASVSGTLSSDVNLNSPNVRTRGIVDATARGMQRVTQTTAGVPVFVHAQALSAPTLVTHAVVVPYPVFNRAVYYGGSDVVFLPVGEVDSYMDRQYGDLRRAMEGTGATVMRRGNDLVVELPADVTFAFDHADIQPRFVSTLAAVARTLDTYRATDVEIVGHTDSIGSDAYNLALSERRGRNVADFLVTRAADPARLVVEAMGESEPVASNATIAGRAANRRVEIIFHPRTA